MRPKIKRKTRNPIAKALREDAQFRLKVRNPKKKPPPEPTVTEALEILEEDECDCVTTFSEKNGEKEENE